MSTRFSLFSTPSKPPQQAADHADIESWFVPPTPPQRDNSFSSSSTAATAGETYEQRVAALKERLETAIASHHLTSVIAGGPPTAASGGVGPILLPQFSSTASSFTQYLKAPTFDNIASSTSTIIPPVSFKDFDSFLMRAKSKSGKAFTPHKEFIPSKPIVQMHTFPQEEMLGECYRKVSPEFFERNFHLYENNATIDDFIDQSFQLLRNRQNNNSREEEESPQEAITRLRLRSEQVLSSQLDLVETCLFNETMMRKDAIFQTIANLQSLQVTVGEESSRVQALRACMAELKQVTTAGRDEVLTFQSKTDNAHMVLQQLASICKAREASSALDLLMRSNDYTGAFLLIEESLSLLEGELNGVFALRTMTRQFREFKETTGSAMSDSFLRLATGDLFPYQQQQPQQQQQQTADLAIKLMPWMRGMLKRGNARACINLYKLEMQKTIKTSSEIVVVSFFNKPSSSADAAAAFLPQNKELALEADKKFKEMRMMPLDDFFVLMQLLFESVDLVLARAKQIDVCLAQHIFPRLVETEQMTQRDSAELTAFSKDCLAQINKTCTELFSKILQIRGEFHQTRCTPLQFKRVYDLFEHRGSAQVLHTQLELLISFTHDRMQKQIVQSLDDKETWEAVAVVPADVQAIVDRIEHYSGQSSMFQEDNNSALSSSQDDGGEESKYLCVATRKLRVLQSALDMIRILQDYLRLALISSSAAWMCVGRMFDCVILFDERMRRLILGTEVKLKKKLAVIGAKNLALTLQSVTAVHLLLPNIAKLCCAAVKPEMTNRVSTELVQRMDKALTDHESSLMDTLRLLVTMELNRLAKLENVQWDSGGTEGLDNAQEYMVNFVSKIDRLYSVLVVNLDRESLVLVFARVLKLIDERIIEIYDNMPKPPTTPAGIMRVKVDILYLISSLRKLKFLQDSLLPGNALEDWINQKYSKPTRSSRVGSTGSLPKSRGGSVEEGA